MTDWTARIDALLADEPSYSPTCDRARWAERCLNLAAERLREPHDTECDIYNLWQARNGQPEHGNCTCGKDSDLLRILEGK